MGAGAKESTKGRLRPSFLFPTLSLIYVMNIEVLYKEIVAVLESKLNKTVDIEYLGEQNLKVGVLGSNFNITITEVKNNTIILDYSTGLIGKGLILALTSTVPGIDKVGSDTLGIDLTMIHEIFNDVDVKSIECLYESIKISVCLKQGM